MFGRNVWLECLAGMFGWNVWLECLVGMFGWNVRPEFFWPEFSVESFNSVKSQLLKNILERNLIKPI
jgi:hypothetical protein